MVRKIHLDFRGYWREPNIDGLPTWSGIYGVYTCLHGSDSTVKLNRLIYIGESSNVSRRVAKHEGWQNWKKHMRVGEEICFNTAHIVPTADRECAEAAMIYKHKPICNSEYKYDFPFDDVIVNTSRMNALMESHFKLFDSALEIQ